MEKTTREGGKNASLDTCSGGRLDFSSPEDSRGDAIGGKVWRGDGEVTTRRCSRLNMKLIGCLY